MVASGIRVCVSVVQAALAASKALLLLSETDFELGYMYQIRQSSLAPTDLHSEYRDSGKPETNIHFWMALQCLLTQ